MAKTIIRITTVPMAFKVLLAAQPKFMREHGFNVIMVSADGIERNDVIEAEQCEHLIVPMTRKITPLQDLKCFFQLRKIIKKYKPDIVHSHTPKAGLLGMMAAASAGVKVRIHTVAGLPLMIETGFKRRLLMFTEWVTYRCATTVWPNSNSMKDFIAGNRLAGNEKLKVIGNGSSNGVNLERYSKENLLPQKLQVVREQLTDFDGSRILCVGRMVKDKGIEELIRVFLELQKTNKLQLLLVGPFEPTLDPLSADSMAIISTNKSIIHINWSDEVEYYMAVSDIFVHPSHREGFPNVILQAGAMQLPVVCSNIPGNTDIIQHDKTGLIFEVKDETGLHTTLKFALENKQRAKEIASELYKEIKLRYDRERIHEEILNNYNSLLKTDEIK